MSWLAEKCKIKNHGLHNLNLDVGVLLLESEMWVHAFKKLENYCETIFGKI